MVDTELAEMTRNFLVELRAAAKSIDSEFMTHWGSGNDQGLGHVVSNAASNCYDMETFETVLIGFVMGAALCSLDDAANAVNTAVEASGLESTDQLEQF